MSAWLFKTLSWFDIAILPRSKHLLISWLQSLSAVILEPKKINAVTVSIFSPSICHEAMGLDAILSPFYLRHILSSPRASVGSSVFVSFFLNLLLKGWKDHFLSSPFTLV